MNLKVGLKMVFIALNVIKVALHVKESAIVTAYHAFMVIICIVITPVSLRVIKKGILLKILSNVKIVILNVKSAKSQMYA
jgi:hypothetical protein